MKIYLLDRGANMIREWKKAFNDCADIEVIKDEFDHFMDTSEVECVVSPANAYGLMDGGYDLAITKWFGEELMQKVQQYLIENCCGEQIVGTAFLINTNKEGYSLIHSPTMRIPSRIKDPMVVYFCMRSTLMTAIKHNVKSIVIPAFGGATGGLPFNLIAQLMREAYEQVMNPPQSIDWDYAYRISPEEKDLI